MSFLESAKKGLITEEMKAVAKSEDVTLEFVQRGVAGGHIVIPVSPYRKVRALGIGKGLELSTIPLTAHRSRSSSSTRNCPIRPTTSASRP